MKIHYYIRNVYGHPMAYASDKIVRNLLRMLTRRSTLDDMDLTALKDLGHELIIVPDPEAAKNFKWKTQNETTKIGRLYSARGMAPNLGCDS